MWAYTVLFVHHTAESKAQLDWYQIVSNPARETRHWLGTNLVCVGDSQIERYYTTCFCIRNHSQRKYHCRSITSVLIDSMHRSNCCVALHSSQHLARIAEKVELHGGGRASRGISAGDIRCLCNFLITHA